MESTTETMTTARTIPPLSTASWRRAADASPAPEVLTTARARRPTAHHRGTAKRTAVRRELRRRTMISVATTATVASLSWSGILPRAVVPTGMTA